MLRYIHHLRVHYHSPSLPHQPALSSYQCRLHHDIHGPEEPLPEHLAKRARSGSVEPLGRSATSPLPDLPAELAERQKLLSNLRELPAPSHAPSTVASRKTSPRKKTQPQSVVHKKSSALLLTSDPDCVLTRFSPPLERLTDPLEIVERLRREPELGFLYLTPVHSQKSVRYSPYNLRQAPRQSPARAGNRR